MKFLSLLSAFPLFTPALAVWPRPQNMTTGETPLRLAPDFSISTSGTLQHPPQDLSDAIQRTMNYLKTDNLAALVPDRGASSAQNVRSAQNLQSLMLSLTGNPSFGGGDSSDAVMSISEAAIAGLGAEDESYILDIPADGGNANLTAKTALGLLRGMTTFAQLWFYVDGMTYTLQAPMQIQDAPYPYRGFMLDTARNYYPVIDLKRTLDAMSWAKMNHFHWHAVDAQSFPVIVPGYEELAQNGAYSASQVYSPDDVKEIISYAAALGIDVVMELDTPGHTTILAVSHPELIACAFATPWAQFANEPPAGQLRVANNETIQFTAGLVKAMSSMFPSKFFNTGGDEINANCYAMDNQTQQELAAQNKTFDQALDTFTQATHAVLADGGKTPVVWEEMVLEHQVQLNNDTLVLVWISSADAQAVAARGFRIIHAASDYFYLDCGHGGWVGNNIDGNSWCDPFKTWQKAYSFDPIANLTTEEAELVVGGQQLLWSEQSSSSNLDSIVWPRAAVTAEVFWSGPGGDVRTALPRLHELAYRYNQRGVEAIPLQPEWCALRDGQCDIDF